MVVVLFVALLMHALVWFTDTLVLAMAVHALYDVVAGTLARRRALRDLRDLREEQSPGDPGYAAPARPPAGSRPST
jgi:hypothetical protein